MNLSKLFIAIFIGAASLQMAMAQQSAGNIASEVKITDTDSDGVADLLDDYPADARKAFNNYSSTGAGATIAFEDQWPLIGDFDMNDLVVDYKYNVITNAKNQVVCVVGDFSLRAAGGDFSNGFGVEFPVSPKSVTGLKGAILEEGQEKAVIILFCNMHTEIETRNTDPQGTVSSAKVYHISFELVDGPSLNDFGLDYNPFLFTMFGPSRREVHLVGKTPTTLADKSLFGTGDDNSDPATGKYYLTKTGFPYAMSVPVAEFAYPKEYKDLGQAYKHLSDWGMSQGKQYIDWYNNRNEGYRNQSYIYSK